MPNGFGFGRGGGGWGMGYGFRGSSPPWPYVGRGRGGLPRCFYPGVFMAAPYAPGSVPYPVSGTVRGEAVSGAPSAATYAPQMTREQELEFLKKQAETAKGQLEQVEARIRDLEKEQ